MATSGFWSEKKRAAQMARELAGLRREVERFDRLDREAVELKELLKISSDVEKSDSPGKSDFEKSISALEKEIGELEQELYFSGKYDKGNAVLSVYSGAGGKDSEDWSALLLRMYVRYAERRGWQVKTIHEHWGEYQGPAGWGIKNATVLVKGQFAYGYLKQESGVHRLVRISPFSAQSLRHTSFALVDVMPEFVAPEEVKIKPADLKIEFFRSSGPGGQNVNKRETAVRVTHLPTGIQVASQAERSQERNREIAMEILRSKLYKLAQETQEKERADVYKKKVSIEWGRQIRSYVMHPYQMVKDHRTEVETSQIDRVLDGELDEFIEAELRQ